MANQVTLQYTITPSGPSSAAVATAMAAVPLPFALLQLMGLRVISDNFPIQTERQVVLAFGPSTTAVATCALVDDHVDAVEITSPLYGNDYILPPIVSFTGGGLVDPSNIAGTDQYPKARAYLNVQGASDVDGGSSYATSTTVTFVGGLPPALFRQSQAGTSKGTRAVETEDYPTPNGPPYALNDVSLVKQGLGYSGQTYVQLQDGILQTGGHEATVIITSFGAAGQITGLQVVDPGAGYTTAPRITFIDPVNGTKIASSGTQAQAVPLMGAGTPATGTLTIDALTGVITGLATLTAGAGYVSPPTMVIYDPTGAGSGAVMTARMGVGNFVVDYPGRGMSQAPTVVLTPAFKVQYPDSSDQRTPFYNFPLLYALQQATASEVVPSIPFLA